MYGLESFLTTGGGLVALFLIIAIVALPLFVWGIHSDAHATRKEMEKLNRNFEAFFASQRNGGVKQEPDGDILRTPVSKRP